jgi:hypothetical protein
MTVPAGVHGSVAPNAGLPRGQADQADRRPASARRARRRPRRPRLLDAASWQRAPCASLSRKSSGVPTPLDSPDHEIGPLGPAGPVIGLAEDLGSGQTRATVPQAFSHLAVINAAINLDRQLGHSAGPAEGVPSPGRPSGTPPDQLRGRKSR